MKSMLLYHRNELKTVKLIFSNIFLSTENGNIYSSKYISIYSFARKTSEIQIKKNNMHDYRSVGENLAVHTFINE